MTLTETRHEFSLYFQDMKADAKREGWTPNRKAEWERFLEMQIEIGDLPKEAINWKLK